MNDASGPSRPQVKCWALGENPPHLGNRYRRLALVSHPRHLRRLRKDDAETLVVSCNWLLWQEAVGDGWHCVSYEAEHDGADPADLTSTIYSRADDWMFVDGADATAFKGVSLGAKCIRDESLVINESERLRRSLAALARRYRPEEFVFFDFREDLFGFLEPEARFNLVRAVAEDRGLRVTDRRDPTDNADSDHMPPSIYRKPRKDGGTSMDRLRKLVAHAYELAADRISTLRRPLGRRRPVVLILMTGLNSVPLLEAFDGKGVYPLLLAKWYPKKRDLWFFLRNLAKGVLVTTFPPSSLSDEDRRRLEAIPERLRAAWRSLPAEGVEADVRAHVQRHILSTGRLEEHAARVLSAERVLDRHKPDVVLTDGLQNVLTTTFLELAKKRGIATVATWHSPYIQDVKISIFGGDPRIPPVVDTCFTWGRIHEKWLARNGTRCEAVRTGSVVNAHYRRRPPRDGGRKRGLILQYLTPLANVKSVQAARYGSFVEVARMLSELGFSEIRLKLHPGASVAAPYYRKICETFGLACDVRHAGPFHEHVAWADVVIGPVTTGAMLEVMAAGKPYYPLLLPPHSVNVEYLGAYPVFEDVASLHRALKSGQSLDQTQLLNDYTSLGEIPDPAMRAWEALRGEAASAPRPRRP